MGGSYALSHGHARGPSVSVSQLSNHDIDEGPDEAGVQIRTPSRSAMLGEQGSGIPTPAAQTRRQSGTGVGKSGRRISSGVGRGDMGPPLERKVGRKLSGVGETH